MGENLTRRFMGSIPSSLPNLCRNQKFCGWHLIRFQIHTSFLCASSSVGRAPHFVLMVQEVRFALSLKSLKIFMNLPSKKQEIKNFSDTEWEEI